LKENINYLSNKKKLKSASIDYKALKIYTQLDYLLIPFEDLHPTNQQLARFEILILEVRVSPPFPRFGYPQRQWRDIDPQLAKIQTK